MGSEDFTRKVFEKVFTDDINRLRSMEDMWITRKAPNPLDFGSLLNTLNESSKITPSDQKAWVEIESFAVFCDSIKRLTSRLQQAQVASSSATAIPPVLSFDKDDDDTLDFVAASANLRSNVFGIEPKSKFEIKQMAGNIIPAIATTNAMTARLCVLHSHAQRIA